MGLTGVISTNTPKQPRSHANPEKKNTFGHSCRSHDNASPTKYVVRICIYPTHHADPVNPAGNPEKSTWSCIA